MSEFCSNTDLSLTNGEDTGSFQIRDVVFNGYTENFAYFLFADGTVQMIDRYTERAILDKAEILKRWNRLNQEMQKHLKA